MRVFRRGKNKSNKHLFVMDYVVFQGREFSILRELEFLLCIFNRLTFSIFWNNGILIDELFDEWLKYIINL